MRNSLQLLPTLCTLNTASFWSGLLPYHCMPTAVSPSILCCWRRHAMTRSAPLSPPTPSLCLPFFQSYLVLHSLTCLIHYFYVASVPTPTASYKGRKNIHLDSWDSAHILGHSGACGSPSVEDGTCQEGGRNYNRQQASLETLANNAHPLPT